MTEAAPAKSPVILGLLPFGGVVLFLVAEIIVLVAGGASDFLYWTTMNAVLFLVGSSALGSGIAHLFFGPTIARSIGWAPGPFQFEVGAANLGIGIAAIVVGAALPPVAWIGPVIVAVVFLVLAGIGHIRQIVTTHNMSINNAGPILFLDFLAPLATLVLWLVLILR
ncbi:MAG: hypothetical protein QM626_09880 [Microbacterium sp.]|uniref:DUF6790 family protein n=1 Tax=Microbacterium sp. TaxID=51671 RepID=UPI0039E2EC19